MSPPLPTPASARPEAGEAPACAPVVFIVFNRPDCTRRVLARIREARPAQLFVVCDGPRSDRRGDAALVAEVRQIVEQGIDWPCVVERDYAVENMGCRQRVSSGLTAAFQRFEEAIVLEDDTLPDPSFFPYCTELLARFRHDERIMHIGATNFVSAKHRFASSYVFSRYGHIWGWASWRRAWEKYDVKMTAWADPKVRARVADGFGCADERGYWLSTFDRCTADPPQETTWDFQWTFACWLHRGISIYPSVNLVENIGWGAAATHTQDSDSHLHRPARALSWPLVHPASVRTRAAFDVAAFHGNFMPPTPVKVRIARAWRRFTGSPRAEAAP